MNWPHYLLASSLISLILLLDSSPATQSQYCHSKVPASLPTWSLCTLDLDRVSFPYSTHTSAYYWSVISPWDILLSLNQKCNSHPCSTPCLFLCHSPGTFHSLICNMVSFLYLMPVFAALIDIPQKKKWLSFLFTAISSHPVRSAYMVRGG